MNQSIQKYLPLALFVIIANFILLAFYQDMLFDIHLRTPFMANGLFFTDLMNEPYGIMQWIGCWISQYCYNPICGSLIFTIIWSIIYILSVKIFSLPLRWTALYTLPISFLLVSVVGIGYWIYILKDCGYFFSHSVALLFMMISLFLAKKYLSRLKYSSFIYLLFTILLYPIIGWLSFVFLACLLPYEIKAKGLKASVLLLAVFIPFVYKNTLYIDCSYETLWRAGFPLFDDQSKIFYAQSAPFFGIVAVLFLFSVVSSIIEGMEKNKPRQDKRPWIGLAMSIVVMALGYGGIWQSMFKDYNYLAEMNMLHSTLNEDWDAVISTAKKSKHPSRSMVMMKNVALINKGTLGDESFQLGNDGLDIYNPLNLNVREMQIVAPTIFYHHGKFNSAIRWSMENCVMTGFSPYYLMTLSQASLANGEVEASMKYRDLLREHRFYRDWSPKPASSLVKELNGAFANVLDSDNKCEKFIIEIFSKAYSSSWASVKELSLFYSMLYGSATYFWPAFIGYVSFNPGVMLPRHYQEAYCLFMEEQPIELPFKPVISEQVVQDYVNFRRQYTEMQHAGYNDIRIKNSMINKWGGTFWWHKYFGRNTY